MTAKKTTAKKATAKSASRTQPVDDKQAEMPLGDGAVDDSAVVENAQVDMPETAPEIADIPVEPEPFELGERMRDKRIQRGKDLGVVAEQLCIRREYLEAIEDGKLENLPEGPYTLGFVRSYASHLNMNVDQAVADYKRYAGNRTAKQADLHFPLPEESGGIPSGAVAISGVAVLVVLYLIFAGVSGSDDTPEPVAEQQTEQVAEQPESTTETVVAQADTADVAEVKEQPKVEPKAPEKTEEKTEEKPEVVKIEKQQEKAESEPKPEPKVEPKPEVVKPAPKPQAVIQPIPKPESVAKPAPKPQLTQLSPTQALSLQSLGNVWVSVRAGDVAVVEKILTKGEALDLSPYGGATLELGNAGLVKLSKQGKISQALGQYGEVKQNIIIGDDLNIFFD